MCCELYDVSFVGKHKNKEYSLSRPQKYTKITVYNKKCIQ